MPTFGDKHYMAEMDDVEMVSNEVEELETAIDVTLENMSTKVDSINTNIASLNTTVTDVVGGVSTKVDTLSTSVNTVNNNVNTVNNNVKTVSTTVTGINTTVGTINTNVNTINTNVANLNSRLTAARASNLDLLSNATNGLAAIKTAIADVDNKLRTMAIDTTDVESFEDIETDIASVKAVVDEIKTIVTELDTDLDTTNSRLTAARAGYLDLLANSTSGLAAIKTAVTTVNDNVSVNKTTLDTLSTTVSGIDTKLALLADTTNGLAAIKTAVSTASTNVSANKTTLATVNTNVANLNTRLTDTRAGYLDLLANSTNGLAAIKTMLTTVNTNASNLNTRLTSTRASNLDLLSNATNGLAAIKTAINNVNTAVANSGGLSLKSVTFTYNDVYSSTRPKLGLTNEQVAGLQSLMITNFNVDGASYDGPLWYRFGTFSANQNGWNIYESDDGNNLVITCTETGLQLSYSGGSSGERFSGTYTFYYLG